MAGTQLLTQDTGNAALDSIIDSSQEARSALGTTTGAANSAAAGYLSSGLDYLNNYLNQANSILQPLSNASYNALDAYYDALGIPRPQSGSAQYAQTYQQYQSAQQTITQTQNGLSQLNSQFSQLQAQMSANRGSMSSGDFNNWVQKTYLPQANQLKSAIGQANSQLTTAQNTVSQINSDPNWQAMNSPNSSTVLASFENNPEYQFALQQGEKAIQQSAAAGGYLNTPGTMKALNTFAQGTASQTYNDVVGHLKDAFTSTEPAISQQASNAMGVGTTGFGGFLQTGNTISSNEQAYGSNYANVAMGEGAALSAIYQGQQNQQQMANAAKSGGQAYQQGFLTG